MSLPLLYGLLYLFLYPHLSSSTYDDPRWQNCDNPSHFFSNSTFIQNLVHALETLRYNTAATGFNTTTAVAAGFNQTYPITALALCRGSLTPPDCQTCIDAALARILLACPLNPYTGGQIWYDYCMVRYSTANFIGKANFSTVFKAQDPAYASDPVSYVKSVQFLMSSLSFEASMSPHRFALGKTPLLQNQMLYGYFDCTRDISREDCARCFSAVMGEIELWCITRRVCWFLTPSCNAQFSMDPAHIDWVNAKLIVNDTSPTTTGNGNNGGSDHSNAKFTVLVAVTVVALVVGLILAVVVRARKRGGVVERDINAAEEMMRREGIGTRRPFLFDLNELVVATANFSPSNFLGRGGFGTVYKGRMPNGEKIAVKKLANGSIQGLGVFFNEVKILLNMQHRNLVRLLGCCVQEEERMLVYEYLPNKSLDNTLFDKRKSELLDWPKRFNIILGVLRGLLYLHEDSLDRIIHRDIKASNILLDEQMNPKISDFGLAKLFSDEKSHLRTRQIAGTYGYMAPEYANQGLMSIKSDVFSFGVLLLEIVSGRKNYDIKFDEEQRQLLNLAWRLEQEGRLMELVDVTMGSSFPEDEVTRCIRIGLLCCQECIQDRPTVSCALSMLSNNSVTIPPAGRPGYHQGGINCEDDHQLSRVASRNAENGCFSVNSITTSLSTQGR